MYKINGNVALVTGAASKRGLARAIALRLAEEGADEGGRDRPLETAVVSHAGATGLAPAGDIVILAPRRVLKANRPQRWSRWRARWPIAPIRQAQDRRT